MDSLSGNSVKMSSKSAGCECVLEIIDDSLMVFGESVKELIYYTIEKDYGLKAGEITRNIGLFHQALEKIFGEGSKVIENVIVKKAYERSNFQLMEGENFLENMTELLRKV